MLRICKCMHGAESTLFSVHAAQLPIGAANSALERTGMPQGMSSCTVKLAAQDKQGGR